MFLVGMAADGSVLAVGAPDSGVGGRVVKVYTFDNGQFVERANVTAPPTANPIGRFGQQVGPLLRDLLSSLLWCTARAPSSFVAISAGKQKSKGMLEIKKLELQQ